MVATLKNLVASETLARWLAVFVQPGQVTELRALRLAGGKRMVSEIFDGDHLPQMATRALECEFLGAQGVYFTPNPLRPDMATPRRAARDDDVLARHWLLIDVDPVRLGPEGRPLADAKVSSTEAERRAAWAVADRVVGAMAAAGFAPPVVGDSGNGWHLCYAVSLPNDDATKEKVRRLLRGLQQRCGDASASVDTSCFNAARIWKLYGTLSRKGEGSAERPHRRSRLVEWQHGGREAAA